LFQNQTTQKIDTQWLYITVIQRCDMSQNVFVVWQKKSMIGVVT
jgi:hypothetical protein